MAQLHPLSGHTFLTVKPLLRADETIEQLPKDSAFARKTKLALNPDKIPDLEWKRATELNTPTS